MRDKILIALSIFLLIFGIFSLINPLLPGASLYLAIGLTLLIYSSPKARICIQWIRSRVSIFHKFLLWIEKKMGHRIKVVGKTLEKTHPLKGTESKQLSHKAYVEKKLKEEN